LNDSITSDKKIIKNYKGF